MIVYAGAIIVTFLFVIMLAQKEGRAIYDRMARAPFLATWTSFLLLFAAWSIYGARDPASAPLLRVRRWSPSQERCPWQRAGARQ